MPGGDVAMHLGHELVHDSVERAVRRRTAGVDLAGSRQNRLDEIVEGIEAHYRSVPIGISVPGASFAGFFASERVASASAGSLFFAASTACSHVTRAVSSPATSP